MTPACQDDTGVPPLPCLGLAHIPIPAEGAAPRQPPGHKHPLRQPGFAVAGHHCRTRSGVDFTNFWHHRQWQGKPIARYVQITDQLAQLQLTLAALGQGLITLQFRLGLGLAEPESARWSAPCLRQQCPPGLLPSSSFAHVLLVNLGLQFVSAAFQRGRNCFQHHLVLRYGRTIARSPSSSFR